MAYVLKTIGKASNIPYHYFECDNESDLSVINTSSAPMGSRCYVINSGKTYALNSQKQWKSVPTGSGSGSDDPGTGGSDIYYDGGEEF